MKNIGQEEVTCREVIISNLTRRGTGVDDDPLRVITQVFEKDGTFIAEYDPLEKLKKINEKFGVQTFSHEKINKK